MFTRLFISVKSYFKEVKIPEGVISIVFLLAIEELLRFCSHVVFLPFSKSDVVSVYAKPHVNPLLELQLLKVQALGFLYSLVKWPGCWIEVGCIQGRNTYMNIQE